jgi:hypothetical protein
LNTELVGAGCVVVLGEAGDEKSNKSSSPAEAFGADLTVGLAPGAESNAPNPLEELNPRLGAGG